MAVKTSTTASLLQMWQSHKDKIMKAADAPGTLAVVGAGYNIIARQMATSM
jgi:hypothetical protein